MLDPFEAGPILDAASADRPVAYATGLPGDMYLLHPLTVHAADGHRGTRPRFMSQGPVFLKEPVAPGEGNALARALLPLKLSGAGDRGGLGSQQVRSIKGDDVTFKVLHGWLPPRSDLLRGLLLAAVAAGSR